MERLRGRGELIGSWSKYFGKHIESVLEEAQNTSKTNYKDKTAIKASRLTPKKEGG
jgi:hypothetical protein